MIHEVSMPALSSTMETGKIVSWLKSPGDRIEKGETILVVESDKANMDVESFHGGILATIVVQEGESAAVGSTIAIIAETEAEIESARQVGSSSPTPEKSPSVPATPVTVSPIAPSRGIPIASRSAEGRVIASPLARKRAEELGVNLQALAGSGPGGRIVVEDVERFAARGSTPALNPNPGKASPEAKSAHPGDLVPLTTLQTSVVRNMMVSLSVPTFHVGYTITTSAIDELYKQVKPKGVTMTALLAKAVAVALTKHPLLNAAYTEAGIHFKPDINVAVAVAMEDGGLITPVLQKANLLDLYELSRQWKDLVDRARQKRLQPEEYLTGSFTISNLGMFGVDRFDAILPPQQGAILAVGASRPSVVANTDGSIAIRPQMQVNLTCDHRVIYGAHAAAFLQDLAKILEQETSSLTL
jgi:pyruvate dehydrogenase E2 component (dihydrolipoamide acetyltransferase)